MGQVRVSLYALMLALAGIPLYIHLPRFATVELGIGMGVIGTVLMGIRLFDLLQDPVLGWMIDRWPNAQPLFAALAALGLIIGFPVLFTLPAGAALWQVVLALALLFSAYSLGTILLYGRSATLARSPAPRDLITLAAWRESGLLAGVVLAAILPGLLAALSDTRSGYPMFGLVLAAIALVAAVLSFPMWRRPVIRGKGFTHTALQGSGVLKLLVIALVNSLPVAITSTLFLFFTEDWLGLEGRAGPLLVLFFLSAGISVPFWAALAKHIGEKHTLLIAMPFAIGSFVGAAFLSPGDALYFAVICFASGAALAADMVILPAMFSIALTQSGLKASQSFGIWSLTGKLGLALAAFLVLPLLDRAGFAPNTDNTPFAVNTLRYTYALLPCALKLGAFALILTLPSKEALT